MVLGKIGLDLCRIDLEIGLRRPLALRNSRESTTNVPFSLLARALRALLSMYMYTSAQDLLRWLSNLWIAINPLGVSELARERILEDLLEC